MLKYPVTLACFLFIFYLFWNERKKSDVPHSGALWVPLTWMFLIGSRYPADWLGFGGGGVSDDSNPVNAASFSLLIVAGVFILSERKIDWGTLFKQNRLIWLYLLFCAVSITWSDYPFTALKRWIKDLGNPIMVLVVLTEKVPYQAMGVVLRRLAILWLPLSVVLNKYFELGRSFTPGGMQLGGIAGEKNALGMICLISGIYFCWNILLNRKRDSKPGARSDIYDTVLVGMVFWLLYESQSATAFGCLLAAIGVLISSRTKFMIEKPVRIVTFMIVAAFSYMVLDATLGIRDTVIAMLGRDTTLTNRTTIWETVEKFPTNPIWGTGYQSFWAGDRLHQLWERIGSQITQAHNGYLEQYLNLGYIGVVFMIIILLSGVFKIRRHLSVDYPAAMLRLCFIMDAVLYNYTEASFCGLSNMWLLTIFAVIDVPHQATALKEHILGGLEDGD